jgi:predicted TPR repeat methyltransferase
MASSDDALKRLEQVYGAGSLDELTEGYTAWATHYDRDVMTWGYQVPAIVAAMTAKHLEVDAAPILDVGAGTGMVGILLEALGYGHVTALDMSANMLAVAEARGCYAEVRQAVLGETLEFPDGRFVGVVAAGVFTAGHAPPESFEEIARILGPRGRLIFGVRADGDHARRYLEACEKLEQDGLWCLEDESRPYRTFPLSPEEAHVLNQVKVYRRG